MATEHYYAAADDIRIYLNTAVATPDATPTWTEMLNAEDPTWEPEKETATRRPRGVGWNLKRGLRFNGPIKFKYAKPIEDALGGHPVDTIFTALEDSFWNKTPIQLALVDRDITDVDVRGVKAWVEVMNFPRSGDAGDDMVVEITCEPTDYAEGGVLKPPVRIGPA